MYLLPLGYYLKLIGLHYKGYLTERLNKSSEHPSCCYITDPLITKTECRCVLMPCFVHSLHINTTYRYTTLCQAYSNAFVSVEHGVTSYSSAARLLMFWRISRFFSIQFELGVAPDFGGAGSGGSCAPSAPTSFCLSAAAFAFRPCLLVNRSACKPCQETAPQPYHPCITQKAQRLAATSFDLFYTAYVDTGDPGSSPSGNVLIFRTSGWVKSGGE